MTRCIFAALIALSAAMAIAQDDKPAEKPAEFSGPQKGEKLTPFVAKGVLGDEAGKEFDPIKTAAGKPVVVVFVHELNRPTFGLVRAIGMYSATKRENGLVSGIVFLTADATETEAWFKRASNSLPTGLPLGISVDGHEGPGAYGLNRKVQMTVLVGKDDKVTANFALVQPSLQADGPKIAAAIADALGQPAPTAEELEKLSVPMRRPDAPGRRAE
jgi:hypothetical protein